jgi:hypothetical protein
MCFFKNTIPLIDDLRYTALAAHIIHKVISAALTMKTRTLLGYIVTPGFASLSLSLPLAVSPARVSCHVYFPFPPRPRRYPRTRLDYKPSCSEINAR